MFRLSPIDMIPRAPARTRNAFALLGLLAALGAAPLQAADDLLVDDPWIREAPPGASALAGYMRLVNHSDASIHLVGAQSDAFDHVMLHRTEEVDGVARMVHQHQVTVPSGETVEFAPGGLHLMLMHPTEDPRPGDVIEVRLRFSDDRSLDVSFTVRGRD
jgi:periplasmic copper chaperone A